MKFIDGLKTYIGIALVFLGGLMSALNPSLIADAIGADAQLSAIINIAFITIGTALGTYGRLDAQRKINEAKKGEG